jgi:hypothetical protein
MQQIRSIGQAKGLPASLNKRGSNEVVVASKGLFFILLFLIVNEKYFSLPRFQ